MLERQKLTTPYFWHQRFVKLTTKHGIHQTMVGEWKRQAMKSMAAAFSGKTAAQEKFRAGKARLPALPVPNLLGRIRPLSTVLLA